LINFGFIDDAATELRVCNWVARKIWPDREDNWRSIANSARVMAVYEIGRPNSAEAGAIAGLIAGMIFHNWDPKAGTIEISGASIDPRWLTRPVLRAMYAYAFEVCGCQLVVQRNSERNERINDILRRLGFSWHRIERLRGRNEAEIVFTLTREEWERNPIYGQSIR